MCAAYTFTRGKKKYRCWNFYDRMVDLKDEANDVLGIPKDSWKKHGEEWRTTHKGKDYIVITPRDDDFALYQEQPREDKEEIIPRVDKENAKVWRKRNSAVTSVDDVLSCFGLDPAIPIIETFLKGLGFYVNLLGEYGLPSVDPQHDFPRLQDTLEPEDRVLLIWLKYIRKGAVTYNFKDTYKEKGGTVTGIRLGAYVRSRRQRIDGDMLTFPFNVQQLDDAINELDGEATSVAEGIPRKGAATGGSSSTQKADPASERRLTVCNAIKVLSRTCGKGGVPREALEERLAGQMKDTDISRALIELGLGGLIDEPHRNQYVLRER